jgi:hypothetical protein
MQGANGLEPAADRGRSPEPFAPWRVFFSKLGVVLFELIAKYLVQRSL